ncbi:DUF7225 domain-containing protein [Bacillus solimangrovi]|uniref:Restriction endonuclease n=1 Tax=Bacillus solimangrovi TaxID=1305675 RepID=A0A1E5LF29_9BACI|nr:hypothetical protein [Bacillus solimangrovi]OEH92685.1 hypothetical protein BFG57_01380 [Bacillus solimangrovi]
MTIYEQIKEYCKGKMNQIIEVHEIKRQLKCKYGTNPDSVILSDYCYNRYNKGIVFDKHLFQYINRNSYKYIGENYPYTGLIFHKPKGKDVEDVVGEWNNGKKTIFEELIQNSPSLNKYGNISNNQIIKLYEEYNQILKYEMSLLNCKPTELRHLLGRIGEFLCAIHTNGSLARQPNQHGFDVMSNGRRISVKTTAQTSGFITINQNTFDDFDDFFVVQYIRDEFKIIYYGSKENIQGIARTYGNKYEIDIKRLKTLGEN